MDDCQRKGGKPAPPREIEVATHPTAVKLRYPKCVDDAELEVVGLTNGETAWKCPGCGQANPRGEAICLKGACATFRPGLGERDRGLVIAVEPTDEAVEAIRELRELGCGNALLLSQIAAILIETGAQVVMTDDGPVAYSVDGNRKPHIWFGEDEPPRRKADLEGRRLVDAVRRIYRIPMPGERPTLAEGCWHCDICKTFNEVGVVRCYQCGTPGESPLPALPPATGRKARGGPPKVLDVKQLPRDRIDPNPFQPRAVYDSEKLRDLGESMRRNGQVAPIVVRPHPESEGRYQMLAGERRLRAAYPHYADLKTVEAKIVEADDRQAVELAGTENVDREQLTQVETIRWYRLLLHQRVYPSIDALAKSRHMSRSALSNLLRILELPADWLELVSQETLPTTHARYLLANYAVDPKQGPAVIPAGEPRVSELLRNWLAEEEGIPAKDDWKDWINDAIEAATRPLKTRWEMDAIRHVGRIQRVFNVELWEQLNEAGRQRDEQRRRNAAETEKGASASAKQKRSAADERKLAKKRAEVWNKRLYRWKLQELQRLIAGRLQQPDDLVVTRILLYFCGQHNQYGKRADGIEDAVCLFGGKKVSKDHRTLLLPSIATVPDLLIGDLAAEMVRNWIQHTFEGFYADVEPTAIEGIAELLGVDLKGDFRVTREFLELHNKEQLGELVTEWKLGRPPGGGTGRDVSDFQGKRGDLIDAILRSTEGRDDVACPKEVLKIKPVRFF